MLENNSGLLVERFLVEFARKSPLLGHQLIWKSKVEMKGEGKEGRMQEGSIRVMTKVLGGMREEEKEFFEKVNGFFDQVIIFQFYSI